LFATVADVTGTAVPKDTCEDSSSFLAALSGKEIESTRAGVVHHSISGHFAYREGKWKLILARASGGWSSPKENQAAADAPKAQLYDLATDPGEQNNLYTSQPAVAQRLLEQLTKYVEHGRSTAGDVSKNDVANIVLWKSEQKKRRKRTKKK
jgi:arylsulfatase A-like enzyme